MTKDFLKMIYADSWLGEYVDYLEPDFFDPNKEVRFLGESRYYDLRPFVPQMPKTLVEQIMEERDYRQSLEQRENQDLWQEVIADSKQRERRLIGKMENRNNAVGDLDKAKQYPIDEIIQFKYGFAKCLWHNEKTPSLHFIKERNTAHCFGCGKSYDSIDAAQQVWGLSFKEAVKRLTNG